MSYVQENINKISKNAFTEAELKEWLEGQNILLKCHSIIAIVRLQLISDNYIELLKKIAENFNSESRVFGIWTNSHFALAGLKLMNTEKSMQVYSSIIKKMGQYADEDVSSLIIRIKSDFLS